MHKVQIPMTGCKGRLVVYKAFLDFSTPRVSVAPGPKLVLTFEILKELSYDATQWLFPDSLALAMSNVELQAVDWFFERI